ncbi:MAG: GNAT family N-acetyltransferase [Lautropia sp.]|nr:GNAT family N-acetyltransferase [Lautropia sp.]
MSGFRFEFYQADAKDSWNDFVRRGRNGVFLFERAYMDYHAHRFVDASVIVRSSSSQGIVAVLPAHRVNEAGDLVLMSHGGLTFGGMVMHPKLGGAEVLAVLTALCEWLGAQGFKRLLLRPVPHIYHRLPSEDDLYALHRLGARLSGVQLSSTLDLQREVIKSGHRRQKMALAESAGVVAATCSVEHFWPVLEQTLQRRHGASPVHSLAEMQRLMEDFPCIECVGAARQDDEELLAGAVLYHYDGVTHTQYMAASEAGYRVAAMNAVVEHVIEYAREKGQRWLNFGVSTVDGGRVLNEGLLLYKERFGARSTVLQSYEIEIGSV